MEQPIYEEMNPMGTDGVADAEQPIYEEMKPVASEGSEPVKEAAVEEKEKEEEEEWEDYVQNLEEYLEDEGLYSTLIVALIEICHKPVNESCCSYCGEIAWYQKNSWLREAAMKEAACKKSEQDGEEEEEEEAEREVCAEYFIEQLPFGEVPWHLFTQVVELAFRKVNPSCCSSCEDIAWYQDHNWVRVYAKRQRAPCVQELYPDIGRVRKCSEVAKTFPGKADPYCCTYCRLLSYCQDSDSENDNEEDSGAGTECETSGDSGVDTEPDAAGGVKEQPPYRAQTPEPEEADPTKDEEEKCPCVQALFPDVWDGPVDFTHLASRIIEKINPDCCYCCGLIELAHKLRDGEFGADPGLPKVTLIEIEGKDLCEFLQGKLMNCTEKQNRCRERDDEKQEKMLGWFIEKTSFTFGVREVIGTVIDN
ncbi:UNVERIFIED_CONTAM: hypothetical protein K2H54_005980 [Gekko kuhli]